MRPQYVVTLIAPSALEKQGIYGCDIYPLFHVMQVSLGDKYLGRVSGAAMDIDLNIAHEGRLYKANPSIEVYLPGKVYLYPSVDIRKRKDEYVAGISLDDSLSRIPHAEIFLDHVSPLQKFVPSYFLSSTHTSRWLFARISESVFEELSEIDDLMGLVAIRFILG